ncbi:signal peptidase I [Brevibacterium sediminis]|uniref:Signal peptidase I n=1 Tax=Brevibacterium sediminis TaxID=1857024 RepID=A0ABQ1MRU9_9MICO|nr:signal peptidase I [Brevibacterium sediminis]
MPGTVGDDHKVPNRHEDATFGSRLLSSARFWKAIVAIVVVIIVLGGSIRGFVIQRFTIPSASMEPTLNVDDSITVWRPDALRGDLQRGDIVVFDGRGSFVDDALPTPLQKIGSWVGLGPRDVYYVKRVIAVGGDSLECCDAKGRLLLNGKPLTEDYAPAPASSVEFSIEVPEGTMWVMGDNRNDSADSRSLLGRPGGGFIPTDRIIGPVIGHGSSID